MDYIKFSLFALLTFFILSCATPITCSNFNGCISKIQNEISNNVASYSKSKNRQVEFLVELNREYEIIKIVIVKSSGDKYIDRDFIRLIHLSSPLSELDQVKNIKYEDYKEIKFN